MLVGENCKDCVTQFLQGSSLPASRAQHFNPMQFLIAGKFCIIVQHRLMIDAITLHSSMSDVQIFVWVIWLKILFYCSLSVFWKDFKAEKLIHLLTAITFSEHFWVAAGYRLCIFRQNHQWLYWKWLYYKSLWIYKGNLYRRGLDSVDGVYRPLQPSKGRRCSTV